MESQIQTNGCNHSCDMQSQEKGYNLLRIKKKTVYPLHNSTENDLILRTVNNSSKLEQYSTKILRNSPQLRQLHHQLLKAPVCGRRISVKLQRTTQVLLLHGRKVLNMMKRCFQWPGTGNTCWISLMHSKVKELKKPYYLNK